MNEMEYDFEIGETCPTGFEVLDRTLSCIRTLADGLDPVHAEEIADAVEERAMEFLEGRSDEQRQRLDALDAAYVELLSSDRAPAKADVEALAEAVLTFYGEIAGRPSGRE